MSDLPTYHKGKRNFGTGYDMMDRIEALEAEAEGAHAVIATERAEVIKLREDLKNAAEVMAVYCDPMNMTPEHEMISTLIINRALAPSAPEHEECDACKAKAHVDHEASTLSQLDMVPLTVQEAARVLRDAPELMEGWSEDGWADICALAEQEGE